MIARHVLTHTLHYGLGCFEGVRAYQTADGAAIFRLHDHTRRLFDSAKILGMSIPFSMKKSMKHKRPPFQRFEITHI